MIIAGTFALTAHAQTETLIRNATVLTVTQGTLQNTDVLMRNGKIAAVGKNLKASANARVIDATGKYVMPGIIDCHSHSMLDTINEGTLSVTSMVRTADVLNTTDVLIDRHCVDVDATSLASMNKGTGYVERQISGWSTRFRNAHTEDIGDYETVMAWLAEHQPDDVASCIIHNDFRFDNIVLDAEDPTRPVGVLDWEMATVGDPLMDLGGTMAYWVQDDDDEFFRQFRRQPTNLPGMMSRPEVVEYYCERTGYSVTPEQWRFYEVYGLFRLGVISQQIYYRYFHKQTSNEAYAIFGPAAQHLEQRCNAIIGA